MKARNEKKFNRTPEAGRTENDLNKVYISNLNYELDRRELRVLFSHFGNVLHVKLVMDPETQRSKGMAFIEMASPKEVQNAIKGLNGQEIEGRTVKVSRAIPMAKPVAPKIAETAEKKQDKGPGFKKNGKKAKSSLATYLARKALKGPKPETM